MNWLLIQLGFRLRWRLTKGDGKMRLAIGRDDREFAERWINELVAQGWRIVDGPHVNLASISTGAAHGK